MPFLETCRMRELLGFIRDSFEEEESMSSLCRRYGISRQWGYELLRRYRLEGVRGLEPRSRAAHRPGRGMRPELAAAILELRVSHPSWGPRKLRALLERLRPEEAWPAASSIGDLLRREGLIAGRRRVRRPLPFTRPFAPVCAPNDLWCIDFKGWFRTGDGARCDALTLSDADSRYLLVCRSVEPTTEGVEPVLERAFRRYGLPRAIRSDNGPPFAGCGAGGLSRLSVGWLKLGIGLERTDPASPQQNARHERLHGTLKRQTACPPARSLGAQQWRFDRFRREYNELRPHEALGQEPPGEHYRPSQRRYPRRIEEPHYPDDQAVRRVRSNGEIRWNGGLVFLSEALIGEPVGLAETHDGNWIVRFTSYPIGLIDRRTQKLKPFAPPRPGRRKAPEHNQKTVNDLTGL